MTTGLVLCRASPRLPGRASRDVPGVEGPQLGLPPRPTGLPVGDDGRDVGTA